MKTVNQVMNQTIQNITLGNEICEGCGEEVEIRKTIIEFTPGHKRESTGKIGCKCEDIKLARETEEAAERIKKKKLIEVFDDYSLVPPALLDATMNEYQPANESQEKAKKAAAAYVLDFDPKRPQNLFFFGPFGVGKSHLCRCISRGVMQRGFSSIFISVPKLLRKLRSTYNKDSELTEDQVITALETVDLLILDDIGAESDSKHAKEKLFDVVDSRQGKATLYTSNLYPEKLLEKDERNFSRVLNGDTDPIEILGENHRLKKFI